MCNLHPRTIAHEPFILAESIRVKDDKSGDDHQICLKRNLSQRLRNHPKNRKKNGCAGRQVRELKRNLGDSHPYDEWPSLFEKIFLQRRNSSHKIYSIHKSDVQCISKRKEHKKYEFGNMVSIIRSATGVILAASSFGSM